MSRRVVVNCEKCNSFLHTTEEHGEKMKPTPLTKEKLRLLFMAKKVDDEQGYGHWKRGIIEGDVRSAYLWAMKYYKKPQMLQSEEPELLEAFEKEYNLGKNSGGYHSLYNKWILKKAFEAVSNE